MTCCAHSLFYFFKKQIRYFYQFCIILILLFRLLNNVTIQINYIFFYEGASC